MHPNAVCLFDLRNPKQAVTQCLQVPSPKKDPLLAKNKNKTGSKRALFEDPRPPTPLGNKAWGFVRQWAAC